MYYQYTQESVKWVSIHINRDQLVLGFDVDLLICAAERLDLHVGNRAPEIHGIGVNALLNEDIHLLPAFLGIVDKVQNHSSGDKKKLFIKPEEKQTVIFFMSSSSRLTVIGASSFCDACSPSWSP